MPDNPVAVCRQAVVLTAERHDLKVDRDAHHLRQPVGHQAPAGHDVTGFEGVGPDPHPNRITPLAQPADLGPEGDLAAQGSKQIRHPGRYATIIRNAGRRHEKGPQSDDVGLAPGQFAIGQALGFDTVFPAAPFQGRHPLVFGGVGGHQEFAALLERQAVLPAKGDGLIRPRLQKSAFRLPG